MSIDAKKYPALAKMESVQDESQALGAFLEWLQENGMTICEPSGFHTMPHMPITASIEALLARYFEVDLVAVENERRAILAGIRESATEATAA